MPVHRTRGAGKYDPGYGSNGHAGWQVVRALLERGGRALSRATREARGCSGTGSSWPPASSPTAVAAAALDGVDPCSSRAPTTRAGSRGRRQPSMRPPRRACAHRQALLDRRSSPDAGRVLGLARPRRGPPPDSPVPFVVLRWSFFMSNLLAAAEPGGSRAGSSRRPGRPDRDGRPARRRSGGGGRTHHGRSRRPHRTSSPGPRPSRTPSRGRALGRDRSRGRVVDVPAEEAKGAMIEAGLPALPPSRS